MKDKRLVTFIYESQSQNYLVFYLVSLILHPNYKLLVAAWLLLVGQGAWAVEYRLSPEREQQFTYHWVAARHALDHEQYDVALAQLLFCEQLNPQDALTKEYIGVLYNAINQKEKGFAYLQQAYQLDPAKRWYLYSAALYKSGDRKQYKTLLTVAKQVAKLQPKDEDAWNNLRQAALANDDYKQALKAQDELDKLRGYDGLSALNRYRVYMMAGKPKKALAEIDRYLAQDSLNLQFWLFKVQIQEAMHAPFRECEASYRQILRLEPNNLSALNNYAYLLATHGGDLRQAESMSQRTIQAQPDNATFLDTYAWILHLQGQDYLAAFYIQKALRNAAEEDKEEIEKHYKIIMKE